MNVVEARCLCYDDDINYCTYPETESNDIDVSSELRVADEVITKMELDLACAAEKLVNLSIHMMRVSLKEAEFEASNSLGDSVETLEFDLLCSFLESQVKEVELFTTNMQENIVEVKKFMSHLGNNLMSMEARLREAEESLKQSQDQILEIRDQSTKFQTTLHHLKGTQTCKLPKFLASSSYSKMQSGKQKRYILRMLEKSLAREMELENKLSEAKQIQQDLNRTLMLKEEQLNNACERWFEAESVAEVFKGISEELVHQYFERELSEISEQQQQEEEEEQTQVSTSDHSELVEDDESSEGSEELIVGQSQALANHRVNLDGWNWGWDFNFAVPSSLFKI